MAVVTQFPTANEVEYVGWTSPNSAHADGGGAAYAEPGKASSISTRWKTFGFDGVIASGSDITAVKIIYKYKVDTQDSYALMYVRARIGGVNQADHSDTTEPLVYKVVTVDITGDRSWTRADLLNAAFMVTAIARRGNSIEVVDFDLDYIKVEVTYSPPSTPLAYSALSGQATLSASAGVARSAAVMIEGRGALAASGEAVTFTVPVSAAIEGQGAVAANVQTARTWPAAIEIWRTGDSAYTDYTSWLWAGDDATVAKTHRLNEPQIVEFALQDCNGDLQLPESGNRIRISLKEYPRFFTGYIAGNPRRELVGGRTTYQQLWDEDGFSDYPFGGVSRAPVRLYRFRAVSEELRMEWQTAAKFHALTPFLNKYQGEIVKELIAILGGGLRTTNVASGILIPYFRVKPEESFMEAVQRLSDQTNMKFWTEGGNAHYVTFNDLGFGYSPNEDDSFFDPASQTVTPVDNPVLNDVMAVGSIEPQAYVREYHVGDGYAGRFPLKLPVYGAVSSKLLEDDFTGTEIDASRWTETDTEEIMAVSLNQLTVDGGAVGASSRLTAKQGLEIGGQLELRAGRVRFLSASDCIIGGLFSADTGALADCIAGFSCTPSGGQTKIQPILNGALVTSPSYTTVADKSYQFLLSVDTSDSIRRYREFKSLYNSYGGSTADAATRMAFSVAELSDSESDDPVRVLEHWDTVTDIDAFLFYTLISGPITLTNSVDLLLNFCLLRKPIQAELWTRTIDADDWRRDRLGDKADPEARAAITVGSEGHVLEFFADSIPVAQERVKIFYRSAGQARARVRKNISISKEANKAGDDGVRSAVLPDIKPTPRNAVELETAIQAFIDDHTRELYEGQWQFNTKTYPPSIVPIPGRFITVSGDLDFTALVTEVVSSFLVTDLVDGTEIVSHAVKFGQLSKLEQVARTLQPADNALEGSLDTVTDSEPVEFNSVGSTFTPDLPDADFTGTLTATTIGIDTGRAGDCEVRKTDGGWGTDSTVNLIATPTTQGFTIPRMTRDLRAYIEAISEGSPSRYSTLIRVVYPLAPGTPSTTLDLIGDYVSGTHLPSPTRIELPAVPQDIWGVEVQSDRDDMVLYRYGDPLLGAEADHPALTTSFRNAISGTDVTGVNVIFSNLIQETSPAYHIAWPSLDEAIGSNGFADPSLAWDRDAYTRSYATDSLTFDTPKEHRWSGFRTPTLQPSASLIKLYVVAVFPFRIGSGSGVMRMRYSTNAGGDYTTLIQLSANPVTYMQYLLTADLAPDITLADLWVEGLVDWSSGSGALRMQIPQIWIRCIS